MKNALYALLMGLSLNAAAYTDQKCAADCRAAGGGYSFCSNRCEVNMAPAAYAPALNTMPDPACVQQCVANGSMWQYCQQQCR